MKRLILLLFILLTVCAQGGQKSSLRQTTSTPKSDVMLQGFYWNSTPGGVWWDSLARLAPRLASAGFSGIWIPAPTKGASGQYSMGYDIYDHFDFGEYNQKGSIGTRFGTRQQLIGMLSAFHANGISVYADAVMGHMNGAEQKVPYACKPYPAYPDSGWLVFNYPSGSGRFRKNASMFYPNATTCDVNPPYHGPSDPIYKFGEILAHAQSNVKDSLIVWGQYMRQVLGFDGFRIDEAKTIDPIFMGPWLATANAGGYAVAEDYDGMSSIQNWLYWVQNFGGNCAVFDFPLRFDLKAMCDNTPGTWNMNWLDGSGLVSNGTPGYNVTTFVDNHDFDRIGWNGSIDNGHNPIVNNKMMAYAYILFSEGRPCVWFRDYFMYGLDGKIDTMMWARQKFLWGGTTKRSGLNPWYIGSTDDQTTQSQYIYVARRDGGSGHPAAYLVINAHPNQWRGVWVNSAYPNQVFRDYSGSGGDQTAQGDGRVSLWAPPRGYALYVPDTTTRLNFPPYVSAAPSQFAFVNTPFQYQLIYGDPNGDSVTFSMSGNPGWLLLSSTGMLSGTPSSGDVGSSTVRVQVTDPSGDTASVTFAISTVSHPVIDGRYEGTGVWGAPAVVGDTTGWDSSRCGNLSITSDNNYFYLGASVRAARWMTWAFLVNTRGGGGSSESWARSIIYSHSNLPDFIMRGTFNGYAEFHTWSGSGWNGIGQQIAPTEYGYNITLDTLQDGWVEVRIPKASLGNPKILGAQFFLTGDQNYEATFAACPPDQITTAWSGVTTRLHYYAWSGPKLINTCNLQSPSGATLPVGGTINVSARIFSLGVTDSAGAGAGIQAWIGVNSANTNPSTWTTWLPAAYYGDAGVSDEYRLVLGTGFTGGTYYYASRFQLNGGAYSYGGYSAAGGGVWDSTINQSGRLVLVSLPAAPSLLTPLDSAQNQPLVLTLSWSPVADAQTYRVQMSADSLFTSLVIDDSTLAGTSRMTGTLANGGYYWRVRAGNIAGNGPWSAVRTFSVNVPRQTYGMTSSWNLVSIPLIVSDPRRTTIFGSAISQAFRYEAGTGYHREDSLVHGRGYWLKFAAPESVTIPGFPVALDTIPVHAGWNLIGSVASPVPVASITELPAGIVTSQYFNYTGHYQTISVIQPATACWVKTDTAGALVLGAGAFAAKPPAAGTDEPSDSLIITDSAGVTGTLCVRTGAITGTAAILAALPPLPPGDAADLRFVTDRWVEYVAPGDHQEFSIRLNGYIPPLSVQWKATSGLHASMKIDGSRIALASGGTVHLNQVPGRMSLIVSTETPVPSQFMLSQNYPNPFNPSTTIRYGLPVDSRVTLRIYNILGERIGEIPAGLQSAGYHSLAWSTGVNGGMTISSGVYLYSLEAIPVDGTTPAWNQTRKMLLCK